MCRREEHIFKPRSCRAAAQEYSRGLQTTDYNERNKVNPRPGGPTLNSPDRQVGVRNTPKNARGPKGRHHLRRTSLRNPRMPIDKTHILDEIRRTTVENGGAPLGRLRFFTETGIKESDWLGVHWIRWSEAIREAGFEANEFTKAYDDDELLQRYADLVREIGQIPVKADLRMKARNDSEFPAEKTFARFGTKSELVRKLASFCKAREGYDKVLQCCDEFVPTHSRNGGREEVVPKDGQEFGFVYLMKSGRFYKIGRSNAAGRREYELSIQLPEKLATVHVIPTDDPTGIEAYWHNRFKDKRKNGEWFDLTAADVAAFRRRRSM